MTRTLKLIFVLCQSSLDLEHKRGQLGLDLYVQYNFERICKHIAFHSAPGLELSVAFLMCSYTPCASQSTIADSCLAGTSCWGGLFLPYSITGHDCRLLFLYLTRHVYLCMLLIW